MLNIINARISITTIVEPTGVSARIEINIPKLAHITDISDEHRITDLNVLNILIADSAGNIINAEVRSEPT